MTYHVIVAAAQQRAIGESRGAWRLADALLEHLPNNTRDTTMHLSVLAGRLEADGVETPAGAPYNTEALARLRDMSIRWPERDRRSQAAFRTHQEAGPRNSIASAALAALCDYAATGRPIRPSGIRVDDWSSAMDLVDKRRESRYPVTANALRLAIGRRTNIPAAGSDRQKAEAAIQALEPEDRAHLIEEAVRTDPAVARAARRSLDEHDRDLDTRPAPTVHEADDITKWNHEVAGIVVRLGTIRADVERARTDAARLGIEQGRLVELLDEAARQLTATIFGAVPDTIGDLA